MSKSKVADASVNFCNALAGAANADFCWADTVARACAAGIVTDAMPANGWGTTLAIVEWAFGIPEDDAKGLTRDGAIIRDILTDADFRSSLPDTDRFLRKVQSYRIGGGRIISNLRKLAKSESIAAEDADPKAKLRARLAQSVAACYRGGISADDMRDILNASIKSAMGETK